MCMYLKYSTRKIVERGGLVVRALDSGVRGQGFDPHSSRHIVSLSKTHYSPKVLVIPRKWWLHPDMTESLLGC